MTTRIIAAVDPNWVIGVDGQMPWHYKADFKRFKERTMGGTLIMGHRTWESLPKPLTGRRTLVLTRQQNPTSRHPDGSCEFYRDVGTLWLAAGSDQPDHNIWIAGGAEIYRLFWKYPKATIDEVDLTLVPEVKNIPREARVTCFPVPVDFLTDFELVSEEVNAEDSRLRHCLYRRPV
jgi:dihydrofolate reductase